MEDDSEVIIEILKEIFGDEKHHYQSKGQIAFNCPICDEDRNKGNLEINYHNNVYKCWSCGDFNNMKGPLGKLIDEYGNKKQKKVYHLLKPEEYKIEIVKKPKVKLPDGFTKFKDSNPLYPVYRQAYNYLKSRGITDDIIEKYNIEKIKTIGDAYMAAGGIPVKNRTNPVEVVLAALEMLHHMRELKKTRADICTSIKLALN